MYRPVVASFCPIVLHSGCVSPRAATTAPDAPVIRIGPGQYFGEIALFVDIPRTAGIHALQDSLLLELRKNDYQVCTQHIHIGRDEISFGTIAIANYHHDLILFRTKSNMG